MVNLSGNIFGRFMSYASDYEDAVKKRKKQIRSCVSAQKSGIIRNESAFQLMNVGWAKELLLKEIQDQVHLCQTRIGFRYLRCHGIFDDDMHVYSVDEQGCEKYNFFMWIRCMIFFYVNIYIPMLNSDIFQPPCPVPEKSITGINVLLAALKTCENGKNW